MLKDEKYPPSGVIIEQVLSNMVKRGKYNLIKLVKLSDEQIEKLTLMK